jgi:hypothetical protein
VPKPIRNNKFEDPEYMKHMNYMMDLAHAMQHEASKLPNNHDLRMRKLPGTYEILYMNNPSLYFLALEEKLHTGQSSGFVKAFTNGNGDPNKVYDGIQDSCTELFQPAITMMDNITKQQKEVMNNAQEKAKQSNALYEQLMNMK